MKNILLINSSLNREKGNSTVLATELLSCLKIKSEVNTIERDLDKQMLPHLSKQEMAAWLTPLNERSKEQAELAALSETLIEELKNSDTIIIGMPMYNFGIPSTFKVWIDRIARAGVTFTYTEQGPVGLITGKKAIIVAARGGIYAGTAKDSQSQYLKDVLALIGITDVEFIYAEGLNMSTKEENLLQARKEIASSVETLITAL
ncbi:FMN-dependent NADH-azoreductase [Thalassotalea piscium]